MDIQSAQITSLKEFYSADQIRVFWKQASDALMSRSTSAITINTTSYDGSTSGGIVLNTPQEMASFIEACQIAINQLNGVSTVDPSSLGTPTSFSARVLQV